MLSRFTDLSVSSDVAYAGVTLSKPRFLPIWPVSQISSGLDEVSWDDHTSALLPQCEMLDVLEDLRMLSHILDKRHYVDIERQYFISTIFSVQYQLTCFTERNAIEDNRQDVQETRSSLFYRNSTSIGFCLYINMVLRKLPLQATLHSAMAEHIRSDLERSGDRLIPTWTPNLKLLLWILFMGASATIGRSEHSYFMRKMELVAIELDLWNLKDFIETIKATVWCEAFCLQQSKILWKEMSDLFIVQQ